MEENQIIVEGLPTTTTWVLKVLFKNSRRQGGGPVKDIQLLEDSKSAIITFEEKSAVDVVLQRGNFVEINKTQCKVSRLLSACPEVEQFKTPLTSERSGANFLPKPELQEVLEKNDRQSHLLEKNNAGQLDKKNATVKVDIYDVTKPLDCYLLYFEDENINTGKFNQQNIFMDGLKKAVYVTFHCSEDAKKVCRTVHSKEENIRTIQMTSDDVHEHYTNLLSIHGMDFTSEEAKAKLQQYVKEKTGFSPSTIMMDKEPHSAILVFDKGVDLYSIAWNCVGRLGGAQLFTAPVRFSKTILACLIGAIDVNLTTVERYFKNERSGGGPLQRCSNIGENLFLLTFEREKDVKSVIAKKEHKIGSTKIDVTLWHHCLSKEAYGSYLTSQGQEQNTNINSYPGTISHSAKHPMQDLKKINAKECQKDFSEESMVLQLKRCEYVLLERSCFIKELKNVMIEMDTVSHSVTMKGNKKSLRTTKNDINEKLLDFENETVCGIHDRKFELLCEDRALEKINDILAEKSKLAYLYSQNNKIYCCKDSTIEQNLRINDIIENAFQIEERKCDDKILALTCNKGCQFISDLLKDSEIPCWIMVHENEKILEAITMEGDSKIKYIHSLMYKINKFLETNNVDTVDLPFPNLQLQFAKKYLAEEIGSAIDRLKKSGAMVRIETNSISVTGLKSGIDKAKNDISLIRDKITAQDEVLNFFGIKEHLSSNKGKEILENLGKKHKCLIAPVEELQAIADGKVIQAKLIGTCDVEKIKLKFLLGDISTLNVDVIVNPVDYKLQCLKGMSKAVVENGGDQIQKALDKYQDKNTDAGNIIATQAGKLPCTSVYHMILQKGEDANKLLEYVKNCLKKASQDGYKSIAMPLLGCGRFKMQEVGAALNIAKAVKQHAGSDSSLKEIIICDLIAGHIQNIIVRFDNVEQVISLDGADGSDDDGEDDSASHRGHSKGGKTRKGGPSSKKFGSLTYTLKKGNILQERCDVIVCGIKENMELSSGGAVSKELGKMCGASLQAECSQKAEELAQEGAVVTSSNGMSCQAIIFVNMNKYSRSWDKGVEKVLSLAAKEGHRSVAMPAFGTGAKHANIPKLKNSIMRAIKKFGEGNKLNKLNEVKLVIFGSKILEAFQNDDSDDEDLGKKHYHKGAKAKPELPIPLLSKSARVQIVYSDYKQGIQAMKDLNDKCERDYIKRKKTTELEYLSDREVKKLTNEGQRKRVQLTVQKESGVIVCNLAGFDSNAMMDIQELISELTLKMKERVHEQELRGVETSIKWQFMRRGKWNDFDSLINLNIEKAFNNSEESVEFEDPEHRKYKVVFNSMKEYRITNGESKEYTTVNRYDLTAGGIKLPKTWGRMADGENLKIVLLSNTSAEYKEVEKYFQTCGANVTIKKIERIQNVVQYQQYAAKKKFFEDTNPKGTENEKKLFHGTDPVAIGNINVSGFNRSFCGKNATVYGNGVYFAEQSSYSVNYCRADVNGDRMMYVAKVLVGVSTASSGGMNYLPNKPGTNMPYDSGKGPNMYIIFHDSQAYPEYLITF